MPSIVIARTVTRTDEKVFSLADFIASGDAATPSADQVDVPDTNRRGNVSP
jgi:hypothetical protein